ncbi:type II secretion system major pseudopilin GspG [Rheinheimera sp.]|uniref:type II secretion system major pseudopilin GspG n=1 Tax=Rheinheimera sp. TaxID=1869214 RepID=UPI00307F9427
MKLNRIQGFTLIELLITIVIIGLLASLVAPDMFSKVSSSKRKTAQTQMAMLETAINTYRLDVGTVPASLTELTQSKASGWDGPYLPKEVPLDPWGAAYDYKTPGDNGALYSLKSFGADKQPGGEGDNEDIIHK